MDYEEWTGLRVYTPEYSVRAKRKKIFLDFLKSYSGRKDNIRVLDLGCYQGDVCKKVKDRGFNSYGLDASEENIKIAKKKYKNINFLVGEIGSTLPFKDNYFDIIWAGDVIEHVYDTIKMFSEFNRILKKKGYLVVSTPMHNKLKMLIITLFDLDNHFHPEHRHIRFYTIKNFRIILSKYGFIVKKENYIGRIKSLSNNMLFITQKEKNLNLENIPKIVR